SGARLANRELASWSENLRPLLVGIGGFGGDANVGQRAPDGEMIDRLQFWRFEPEKFMGLVVEETADAGAAQLAGLGFEIEGLADQTGLPMQLPVEPGVFMQRLVEFG